MWMFVFVRNVVCDPNWHTFAQKRLRFYGQTIAKGGKKAVLNLYANKHYNFHFIYWYGVVRGGGGGQIHLKKFL